MNFKEAWGKFDRGDGLKFGELVALRYKLRDGLNFLETRNSDESRIAARQARADLTRIEGYIEALQPTSKRKTLDEVAARR